MFLLNFEDEQLRPEVTVLMQPPINTVPDQNNGFFMLNSLSIHSSFDPMHEGAAEYLREEARFYLDPIRYQGASNSLPASDLPVPIWLWGKCLERQGNCLEELRLQASSYKKIFAESAVLIQRYERLQAMSEFEEHVIPSPLVLPLSPGLSRASEMQLALASLEFMERAQAQGIARLQKNDAFLRLLLRKTSTLTTRTVAISMLRKQVFLLAELVHQYPALFEKYHSAMQELARPLTIDEQKFAAVLQNEERIGLFFFNSVQAQTERDITWYERATTKLIHPHVLMNMLEQSWRQRIRLADLLPSEYRQTRLMLAKKHQQLMEQSNFPYINFISRQTAKILIDVAAQDSYFNYMEKSADLDGYLRLLSLQIEIQHLHLPEEKIAAFVDAAAPQFRNPYDGSAMQWNPQLRQLKFVGRQDDGSGRVTGRGFVIGVGSI